MCLASYEIVFECQVSSSYWKSLVWLFLQLLVWWMFLRVRFYQVHIWRIGLAGSTSRILWRSSLLQSILILCSLLWCRGSLRWRHVDKHYSWLWCSACSASSIVGRVLARFATDNDGNDCSSDNENEQDKHTNSKTHRSSYRPGVWKFVNKGNC